VVSTVEIENVLRVETNFFEVLRLSITSRSIFFSQSRFSRPSGLTFFWCRDRESPLRPRRDKSRPLGLTLSRPIKIKINLKSWDKRSYVKVNFCVFYRLHRPKRLDPGVVAVLLGCAAQGVGRSKKAGSVLNKKWWTSIKVHFNVLLSF